MTVHNDSSTRLGDRRVGSDAAVGASGPDERSSSALTSEFQWAAHRH